MKKICLIILLISPAAFAQFNGPSEIWGTSHLQKADMLYAQNFYEEAIVYYKKELEKFDYKEDAMVKLARCYKKLADYRNERNYYLILAQTNALKEPDDIFNYAEALLSVGEYEESTIWFNNYLETVPGDKVAVERLRGLENIREFVKDSTYRFVKPVSFNSEYTEFGAIPYMDGILFTSSREKDLVIRHDNLRQIESLLDMYYLNPEGESDIEELERIKISNHFISNDGPASIGKNLIVVTRNNGKKKDEVYNSLGLQFFFPNEYALEHLYEFPHNNHSYSIMHPTLSSDEDTLFFASDMPGGFGGMDIFYSLFDGETWMPPVNVGAPVNTAADEIFPFAESGVLFFSSNGHQGMGGLDIYSWDPNDSETQDIENLGYPINSGWDDFSIYLQNGSGYIASNRPGGLGHDDIYEIQLSEIPEKEVIVMTNLKLNVSDFLNDDRIDSAEVVLVDKQDQSKLKYFTSDQGELNEMLTPSFYLLSVIKPGFEEFEIEIDLLNVNLKVEEVFLRPHFDVERISLDSILFEYNDFRLSDGAELELDNIIEIMNKYETVSLQVAAHTDSRGEKEYNHWLSEMRAASTANYLIEQGIPYERMQIVGYGEEQILNHCKDKVPCTDQEHSVNRRIEFQLLYEQ